MKNNALLFLLLIGHILAAQDSLSVSNLEVVEVTYQANKTTPITFLNLSGKVLNVRNVGQEPSFLLSETPSITSYSDAGSMQGYSYIRLRGIDQTRLNITFDGVPINEPEDQGAYFSNYPDLLNSLSKIQIQRGVGTTKNGMASYAGSIELFSPNLSDSASTTIGLGYGSFNNYRTYIAHNTGSKNGKGLYVRASKVYADGYKHDAFNNSQSILLGGGLFYDKSSWKFNILAGNQKNGMAWLGVSDSLIQINRRTNANAAQERDDFTQCLTQIQNFRQIGRHALLRSSVYYTFLDGDYGFDFNNFLGFPSTEELYNYAFRSHLYGFFSNYQYTKGALEWTVGIHGNTYNRQHIGSEKTLGRLYDNTGYKDEISIFSKAEYTIGQLTLFADIQYRYAFFNYKGAVAFDQLNWDFINPKAGLNIALKPNLNMYASIARTGREPTRNDIFGGNDDLLADDLGNALLFIQSPEYVTDVELGVRHQSGKIHINANLYYLNFENEIVLNGNFGPNGLALTNKVDQSIRTGVEISLNYRLNDQLSLINNSSFNYSKIKEQDVEFLPILTPPLIINQTIEYTYNALYLALDAKYQDDAYIDFSNEVSIDAYFLLNARLGYRFKQLQLDVLLNNLTNADYFNNGYVDFDGTNKYFVQAPLNFFTSLKYSF